MRTANKDFVTTEVEPMWDAADVMRMGKDLFIQHGLTANRTAMDWFQRYPRPPRARELPRRPVPDPHRRDLRAAAPGPDHQQPAAQAAEEQRAIFEPTTGRSSTPPSRRTPSRPRFCYSSVWLSMNCLVLDPKTVIVEASEVYQQEEMDKLGMNVIPVDLRGAYAFGGGLHCSTADVYREGECLDYFPNRVADPTLVRPEMWND